MMTVAAPPSADARLVQQILEGDRRAFTDLLRRYDPRLRALAYKLLGGDRDRMDDALQEAYFKAYRSLRTFRHEADLGTWLYRIVYNACIDEIRRGRHTSAFDALLDTDVPSTNAGPEQRVAAADAALRALASLNEEQRAVVVLIDAEGFDQATAAEILGIAPGTVASRLSRGRARVRELLGGTFDD